MLIQAGSDPNHIVDGQNLVEMYLFGKNEPNWNILRRLLRAGFDATLLSIQAFDRLRPAILEVMVEQQIQFLRALNYQQGKSKINKRLVTNGIFREIFKYTRMMNDI